MGQIIAQWMPNVVEKSNDFWKAIADTLVMTAWSGVFIFVIGLAVGITLTVTTRDGIAENAAVYQTLDKIVNLLRSIPFIILLAG